MRDIIIFTAIISILLIALMSACLLLVEWIGHKRESFFGVLNKLKLSTERVRMKRKT